MENPPKLEDVVKQEGFEQHTIVASRLSHDINNYLMPILGFGEYLVDELEDEEHKEILGEQIESARSIAKLVKSFAVSTRLDTVDRTDVSVDARSSLQRYLNEEVVTSALSRKEIVLDKNFYAEQNNLSTPLGVLSDAVDHLVQNSIESINEDAQEKTISITTQNVDISKTKANKYGVNPGKYYVLSVEDTGAGMTEEVKQNALIPFFSTKQDGKRGRGLGLSFVYANATKYGGFVGMHSEEGKGTRIDLWLPVTEIEESEIAGQYLPIRGKKILLVDDMPNVADVTARQLKKAKYNVEIVPNAQEALQKLQDDKDIGFVMTDVDMPVMDGTELYNAAKNIDGVNFLFYSGREQPIVKEICAKQPDRTGFIGKPFGYEALSHVLEPMMSGKD